MDGFTIPNNANDEYWFFDTEIDKKTCDKIIKLANDWRPAEVISNINKKGKNLYKKNISSKKNSINNVYKNA